MDVVGMVGGGGVRVVKFQRAGLSCIFAYHIFIYSACVEIFLKELCFIFSIFKKPGPSSSKYR